MYEEECVRLKREVEQAGLREQGDEEFTRTFMKAEKELS